MWRLIPRSARFVIISILVILSLLILFSLQTIFSKAPEFVLLVWSVLGCYCIWIARNIKVKLLATLRSLDLELLKQPDIARSILNDLIQARKWLVISLCVLLGAWASIFGGLTESDSFGVSGNRTLFESLAISHFGYVVRDGVYAKFEFFSGADEFYFYSILFLSVGIPITGLFYVIGRFLLPIQYLTFIMENKFENWPNLPRVKYW